MRRFFPDAKVYTTDMNPTLAPAAYVSDKCFIVPRCTAEDYVDSTESTLGHAGPMNAYAAFYFATTTLKTSINI